MAEIPASRITYIDRTAHGLRSFETIDLELSYELEDRLIIVCIGQWEYRQLDENQETIFILEQKRFVSFTINMGYIFILIH